MPDQTTLLEQDRKHLLHPLHHPSTHEAPIIIESGQGVWLQATDGKRYLDGLSGLWNVQVGHGNTELADAAQSQMGQLAYYSNYVGTANLPAIQLADKLAGFAYPNLNMTFFASGGAEANESAFKTARYYWKGKDKPDKVKIISRRRGYTRADSRRQAIDERWVSHVVRWRGAPKFLPDHPLGLDFRAKQA